MFQRRTILHAGAALAGAASVSGRADAARGPLAGAIARMPNFCTHEHWGSIDAIGGWEQGGFAADMRPGATPDRPVTIVDLVFEPYFAGWVKRGGLDADAVAKQLGVADLAAAWIQKPKETFAAIRGGLQRNVLNGGFQTTRRGIQKLHGHDIARFSFGAWQAADRAIAKRYVSVFDWYATAKKKAGFTELMRPVHPEFFDPKHQGDQADRERAIMRPVLRIDPLVGLGRNEERRKRLARQFGVEPRDAKSWRQFLVRVFEAAARGGAVSIKQLQAYSRVLDFKKRDDSDVDWSGTGGKGGQVTLQDWVVHECCQLAHDRGWPHQVHTGTANLPASNPLPLRSLARRYPKMPIVMIHCWPFLQEAGYLAKNNASIHVDSNWQVILNPSIYRQALTTWLGYMPSSKIHTGHDATTVEMAVGSSLFVRETLAETLDAQRKRLGLKTKGLLELAANILQNNAVRLYAVGEETKS